MGITKKAASLFQGFSKLNREQRFARLVEMGALTENDVQFLQNQNAVSPNLAEDLIENVIGYFHLPLGVAANFRIDGDDYVIPMAVEETSIIAAASKTAKWVRDHGEITTSSEGDCIIGQIQIPDVVNVAEVVDAITRNKKSLITEVNQQVALSMKERGGGVMDLDVRVIDQQPCAMVVVHIYMNPCDAMGANIMNQVCEFLKTPLELLVKTRVGLCILSNLNDRKLTKANVIIRNIDHELGKKIEAASIFGEHDPYRAATSNKGVLNGIDPIVIATGNDWRAVEAGVHSYAARSGQYRSITTWRMHGDDLIGEFIAPIVVGTVGGVTKLHPTAQLCLQMIGAHSASHLARIMAAVGLVQNLGALTALATVGIISGHMKLHIANLALSAGAAEHEREIVEQRLEKILLDQKRVSLSHANLVLAELRESINE